MLRCGATYRRLALAHYAFPHREGPREDFDLAAYGIVKVQHEQRDAAHPDMQWAPKAATSRAFGPLTDLALEFLLGLLLHEVPILVRLGLRPLTYLALELRFDLA